MKNNNLKKIIQEKYQFKTKFNEVPEVDEEGGFYLFDETELHQEDGDYIYQVASRVLEYLESKIDFEKDNVYYEFKVIDEKYVRININLKNKVIDDDEFSLGGFFDFSFEDDGQEPDYLFSFRLEKESHEDNYKIIDFKIDNNYIDVMSFIESRSTINEKAKDFIKQYFYFLIVYIDKDVEFKNFSIQLKLEHIESLLFYDENEWHLCYDLIKRECVGICLEKDIDRVKLLISYMDTYCFDTLNDSKDDVYYKIEKLADEKVGKTKEFETLYDYFLEEDVLSLEQYMDNKMKPYRDIQYYKMVIQEDLSSLLYEFEVKENYTYLVFNFNNFIYSFKVDLVRDLKKVVCFMYCLQICSFNIDFSFFSTLEKTIKRDRDIDSAFKYFIAAEQEDLDKNIEILNMLID